MIRQQSIMLTQKLTTFGELQKAYFIANTTFENLHLKGGSRCAQTFH